MNTFLLFPSIRMALALSWYQWMYHNSLITSWQALLQELESYFASSFYNDPRGALFKLT